MAKLRRSPNPQNPQAPIENIGDEQVSQVTEEIRAPLASASTKPIVLVANKCSLLEPHENIWFVNGKPREVYRVTKWMEAQIAAGLLQKV